MGTPFHRTADTKHATIRTQEKLMRLLCLLPAQSAPARRSDIIADMKISKSTLENLIFDLESKLGVTVESSRRGIFIHPASWAKAQELGMAYAGQEAA